MTTIWSNPEYPGAAVRVTTLVHDQLIGQVRIQHYGEKVMVAAYLPGVCWVLPGDTPKTTPEFDEWFKVTEVDAANRAFDKFVKLAKRMGWHENDC